MRTIKASLIYFLMVFGAGFILGTIRVLCTAPAFGERIAELLESPIMLVMILVSARYVVDHQAASLDRVKRVPIGVLALLLMLLAEVTTAVELRHLTFEQYVRGVDPVSRTVYLSLLLLFGLMPALSAPHPVAVAERTAPLDQFVPLPVVCNRHEVIIAAPANVVFKTAMEYDLGTDRWVQFIFWLRARLLGTKGETTMPTGGLIDQVLRFGWKVLASKPNRFVVLGAVCQPWRADVVFQGVSPDEFTTYAKPGMVKIVWTVEAKPICAERTRFGTETRVTATDQEARARFLRYWIFAGIGSSLIRRLLIAGVRRDSERRWKHDHSVVVGALTQ